jgi:hypothetical protein
MSVAYNLGLFFEQSVDLAKEDTPGVMKIVFAPKVFLEKL